MSRVLPILFNIDMVRAILDEQKQETRRVIKQSQCMLAEKQEPSESKKDNLHAPWCDMTDAEYIAATYKPPYSRGDILYVRETYCPNYFDFVTQYGNRHGYKADYDDAILSSDIVEPKWTPSIHMPKEAARIWLKVTDVRVERLQDMNGQDILREGINCHVHPEADYFDGNQIMMFAEVWNSTIRKPDLKRYGWDANPWVWTIEFERCRKPEEL